MPAQPCRATEKTVDSPAPNRTVELKQLTDEELITAARDESPDRAQRYLNELFERYYAKVARWCLRVCGDRDDAADTAQNVFLQVQTRLGSFKGQSRFSTWLYVIARRIAINDSIANRHRQVRQISDACCPELADPAPSGEDKVNDTTTSIRVKQAMAGILDSLELSVLHLHFVDHMSLPAITQHLGLENKSGAKAYIVNARRKLHRRSNRFSKLIADL